MSTSSLLWRLSATFAGSGGFAFLSAAMSLLRRGLLQRAFRIRQPRPWKAGHVLRNYLNVEQKLATSSFYPTMAKVWLGFGIACEVIAIALALAWLAV